MIRVYGNQEKEALPEDIQQIEWARNVGRMKWEYIILADQDEFIAQAEHVAHYLEDVHNTDGRHLKLKYKSTKGHTFFVTYL